MTTSSDGYLTVTANNTYAGADISVDFGSVVPQPTVNLIINPAPGVANILANPVGATLSRTVSGGAPYGAGAVTSVVATAAGSPTANTPAGTAGAPVFPGLTYSASLAISAAATLRTITVSIIWYTSAGAVISTVNGAPTVESAGVYTRVACNNQVAPATAAFAAIKITIASVANGEVHYTSGAQLEQTAAATAYSDGAQTGSMWTGTAYASMSLRPAYDEVTVYTGSTTVFGLTNAVAPNGQTDGFDMTVPAGGYREYIARVSNGLDAKYSTLASVTSGVAATTTWLKSARYPALSQPLTLSQAPDWVNDIAMGVQYPLSGRYPVVTTGMRRAETGSMVVECQTRAEYDALMALVSSDGPFLLQLAANSSEPDVWVYLGAIERAWAVQVASDPWRTLRIPLVVVATPPVAGSGLAIPGHTYLASSATWPLYSSRTGSYGSR